MKASLRIKLFHLGQQVGEELHEEQEVPVLLLLRLLVHAPLAHLQ